MEVGETYFKRYKVLEQLGCGAYGIVWLADDQLLHRRVAIKELTDRQHAQRLIEEASAAAQTQHPNIVQVYDIRADPEDDLSWYVMMEYLAGGSLRQRLHQQGKLAPERAFEIISAVCEGLKEAHSKERPIIHGDIKPDNIMFDDRDVVKITDFGAYLPRKLGGHSYRPAGTPLYQTPQLLLGGAEATVQDDLYAVVVMLYEMLCGSFVTEDKQVIGPNFYLLNETAMEGLGMLIHLFANRAPVVLPTKRNPALTPRLDAFFIKGLAFEPKERFQAADELIQALREAFAVGPAEGFPVEDSLGGTRDAEPESYPEPRLPSPHISDELVHSMISRLRHGWVADPWQEENPYEAMEALFVGPMSSMREIRDHSPAEMTQLQRASWKRLQDISFRLLVDSFLYCVEQNRELIALIREQHAGYRQLRRVEQVPPDLQHEWPLVLLLSGAREEAVAAWTDIQNARRGHADLSIVHSLALAHTFLAQRQEKEGQIAAAIASWRKAIANWVWVLADDGFWKTWASSRSQYYQVQITSQHISDLRRRLHDHFTNRFAEADRVLPSGCPAEIRQEYEELGLEWQIERAGLRALKRLQEDQLGSQRVRPVVGPLLVSELGLEEPLARLILDYAETVEDIVFLLTSSLDAQRTRQNAQDVRLYYSQLNRAAARLDCSQPERALSALSAAEESHDFDHSNPAYRLLPDRETVWEKDRVELAMRAHLQLANAHLRREPWDIGAIGTQWAEILSLGVSINGEDLAINMIEDQVQAYLQPTVASEDGRHQQLVLAEAAQQVIGLTPRLQSTLRDLQRKERPTDTVASKRPVDLASLLSIDKEWQGQADASWQRQINELYDLLEADPGNEDARERLTQLLTEWLEQLIDGEQIETARHIADEWYDRLGRPSRLQELYRFLRHGYKVASYLPQTGLKYHTGLLEAHTFTLGFSLKHVQVTLKLKVVGDLVRIFAPLPQFVEPVDTSVQRGLLRVTHDMPLFRACRESGGLCGLMVEVLAHSLTPPLLKQLIRSLASRVDLSAAHLQSLSVLQGVMDMYAPDLSLRAGEPPTESSFEHWQGRLLAQCRQSGLECTVGGDYIYRLKRPGMSGVPIQLDLKAPVATFWVRVGDQYKLDHDFYERMMQWNNSARLCKLVLAPDDGVMMRCEVLDLGDEETLARILILVFEGLTQSESVLAWHML